MERAGHVEVEGSRAYVVVPASETFTQRGKRMTESVGWRITAWAWAAGH
ncbi:MAG: hypothetical protein JO078_02770 [Candidatus Eremiobacteraeota bacterium]|nr:hypothetical protein [Candidatus Eremiobacteraeota bacterium]MBV9699028.1 hypothetical protein [Candidatus Eremiobacteraeota bacterium]